MAVLGGVSLDVFAWFRQRGSDVCSGLFLFVEEGKRRRRSSRDGAEGGVEEWRFFSIQLGRGLSFSTWFDELWGIR